MTKVFLLTALVLLTGATVLPQPKPKIPHCDIRVFRLVQQAKAEDASFKLTRIMNACADYKCMDSCSKALLFWSGYLTALEAQDKQCQ